MILTVYTITLIISQSIVNQEVDPSDEIESETRLHCTVFAGQSQVHPVLHV